MSRLSVAAAVASVVALTLAITQLIVPRRTPPPSATATSAHHESASSPPSERQALADCELVNRLGRESLDLLDDYRRGWAPPDFDARLQRIAHRLRSESARLDRIAEKHHSGTYQDMAKWAMAEAEYADSLRELAATGPWGSDVESASWIRNRQALEAMGEALEQVGTSFKAEYGG